jgi:hypothetical protein
MAITNMRLCERMHLTPQELADIPAQTILDWITIMGQEAQIQKENQRG